MAKKKAQAKKTAGRPSKFDERYIDEAEKLAMLGLTDKQLAAFWEISTGTLHAWGKAHPAFLSAIKAGKAVADGAVAQSLFKRATGYSHPAVKIFMPADADEPVYAPFTEHYPPDATSMIFWLKNRRPDLWRDKSEVLNKNDPADAETVPQSALQLAREIAFALRVGVENAAGATKSESPDTPTKH